MKRTALIFIFVLFTISLMAQKNTPMRAYNLYYEKDFVKAKECIDECIKDEKYAAKANTWLYKANIEYNLALEEYNKRVKDANYQYVYPTAARESYKAFQKAQELNKNIEATDMYSPFQAMPAMYPMLFIEGVDEMTAKNFEAARDALLLAVNSYELKTPPSYPLKGELYYYCAYVYTMLDDPTNARIYFQKSLDDGSENANVFVGLVDSYKEAGDKDGVYNLISKGLQKDPESASLRVAEADYYFWIGETEKGIEKLKNLPASVVRSPESAINAANLYIQKDMYEEAEQLLVKAYRQSPDNTTIAHNLGVCCSNLGERTYLDAEKIKLNDKENVYSTLRKKSDEYLARAAEYFEAALVGTPNDLTVLKRLKQIYLRLLQDDKANAIEQKIKQLE